MSLSWPAPQPQPETPIRGPVIAFGFDDVRAVRGGRRRGQMANGKWQMENGCRRAVKKVFEEGKALSGRASKYGLKPKRNSRGVIWGNRAFYWSTKGYYRPGKGARRRPLHHLIWEEASGKEMDRLFEVVFRNGDRHDFRPSNLECLHKAEVHRRSINRGMLCNQYLKTAKERLGLMLNRFASGRTKQKRKSNGNYSNQIKWLGERRYAHSRQAGR